MVKKQGGVVGMTELSVEKIKSIFKKGMKVELKEMVGESDMSAGLQGIVAGVDDIGNILVCWGNGRTLSLIYGQDKFKVLGSEK